MLRGWGSKTHNKIIVSPPFPNDLPNYPPRQTGPPKGRPRWSSNELLGGGVSVQRQCGRIRPPRRPGGRRSPPRQQGTGRGRAQDFSVLPVVVWVGAINARFGCFYDDVLRRSSHFSSLISLPQLPPKTLQIYSRSPLFPRRQAQNIPQSVSLFPVPSRVTRGGAVQLGDVLRAQRAAPGLDLRLCYLGARSWR